MNLNEILEKAIQMNASDVFLIAGLPISIRQYGKIVRIDEERQMPGSLDELVGEIYKAANNRDIGILHRVGDDDFHS